MVSVDKKIINLIVTPSALYGVETWGYDDVQAN
jgi:hypothetical protein